MDIIAIQKTKVINQNNNPLSYFKLGNPTSKLEDYSELLSSIKNAEQTIFIASMNNLHPQIIDALYKPISKGVRVYMILASFDLCKETLLSFNAKNPIIIREAPLLKNNFVIIDHSAQLFFNSLSNNQNIGVLLSPSFSNDLIYWFNDYFWNKSTKEQIIDKVAEPKESPYPPFSAIKENISLVENTLNADTIIVPRDKQFIDLKKQCALFLFSPEIESPIYFINNQTQIGDFLINQNYFENIGQHYELQQKILFNIDSSWEIFPLDQDWKTPIKIQDQTQKRLATLNAPTIEEMNDIFPETYPKLTFFKTVEYIWSVNPPVLPKQIKKSRLYQDYEVLQTTLNKNLETLERVLNQMLQKESSVIAFFTGTKRKAREYLKEIEAWKIRDFKKLSINELKDQLTPNGQFKQFYDQIIQDANRFSEDLDKKEKEASWEKQKMEIAKKLQKKKLELIEIQRET